MDLQKEVIRIGVSPMTPPQVFVTLWPKIQKHCPEMKFKLVPFENTPENAREAKKLLSATKKAIEES